MMGLIAAGGCLAIIAAVDGSGAKPGNELSPINSSLM
jgi:hypothetical protein